MLRVLERVGVFLFGWRCSRYVADSVGFVGAFFREPAVMVSLAEEKG